MNRSLMNPEETEARAQRVAALRAQHKTFAQIGAELGVSASRAAELLRPTRNKRHRDVRAVTIPINRQTKRERVHLRLVTPDTGHWRPTTRADCDDVPRPCPYVGCEFNLYLDVSDKAGNLKLNFPDLEPDQVPPNRSCALDLAELGGMTLEETGEAMNVTRERIRQIENKALRRLEIRGTRLRGAYFERGAGFPDTEGE